MFKKNTWFSSLGISFLVGMMLLLLISVIPINGKIFKAIQEGMTSICGDGYAIAASSTIPTGIQYPNPNYVYYNNALSTTPATIVSSDTFSGDADLYLKKILVSNTGTIDSFVTLTSSETDSASTEIASFNVPKANGVNQPTFINLDWLDIHISSDTKLKIEASTSPGSGYIKCSLQYEKY